MYNKFKHYIMEYNMLEGIDSIVIGLSGGGDSVCLLLMLEKYIGETTRAPKLVAVHIHHGIRGEEANRDAAFCKNLCDAHKIEYHEHRYDIKAMAKEAHMSEEEMGRKARYETFSKYLPENGRGVIAVAHHKNDQAETVLFNLSRGSNIKGVRGMEPVAGNIIRPLLCLNRQEIEQWLHTNNIEYCTDSTNAGEDYSRNKMRNVVIPYLEENINSEVVNNLCRFANGMAEIEDMMDILSRQTMDKYYQDSLLREAVVNEPVALRKRVVYDILESLMGARDLENKHVEYVLSLLSHQCGHRIDLPKGIVVKRTYEGILFTKENNHGDSRPDNCGKNKPSYAMSVREVTSEDARLIEDIISKKYSDDHYTKYFDYGKIRQYIAKNQCGEVVMRHRESGDFFTIDEQGRTKTVKSLLIDKKIKKDDRENIWLFAVGSHVLFIPGIRRTEDFRVTHDTKELLVINMSDLCMGSK